MNKFIWVILTLSMLGISGCQNSSLYYWSNYEPLIYSDYANPGEIGVVEQIELLEQDIVEAEKSKKPLPPGFYAHLAYLHFQNGNMDMAISSFKMEKEIYPESSVFMDRLIQNIEKK